MVFNLLSLFTMNKKHLLLFVFFYISFVCNTHAESYAHDTLVNVLRNEVQFYFDKLKNKETPAYFISLRVVDNKRLFLSSDFGLSSMDENHTRILTPQVRVGSPDLDNFAYLAQNRPSSTFTYERPSTSLPLDCDAIPVIKEVVWNGILERYEAAVKIYQQMKASQKTNVTELDSVPTFAPSAVETYYERPYSEAETGIDKERFQKYINDASRLFKDYELTSGKVFLDYSLQRTTIVNTEGTVIAQNRKAYRLMLEAVAEADDGTPCPLYEDIFAFSEKDLPTPTELEDKVRDLAIRAEALGKAPMAEAYTGPAILSGKASAVFFHEVLGHRLEGKRRESVNNEISGMLNQRILPASFQLYLDPTLTTYQGKALSGHYLYDDEGVKGQRVDCVKDGYLRQYLMSRTPVKEFTGSNGHGRAANDRDPNPRQSNLIVETTEPYSETQLRNLLIEELKRQGKEYGYYFRTVKGGFTTRGKANAINAFNVSPIEVYRVFADGRDDQLVRGVSLIGTPLSMFSQIKAAGGESELFTGFCGSESGSIPVSGTSPMVYVSQIETQGQKAIIKSKQDLISSPKTTEAENTGHRADCSLIFKAMEDEMAHVCHELATRHNTVPLFVNYVLERKHISETESSGGVCVNKRDSGIKNNIAAHIFLGDSLMTSDTGNELNAQSIPDEIGYGSIRNALRTKSEIAYQDAVQRLDCKRTQLKQNPKPADDAAVPEFKRMPPAVWIGPSALTNPCPVTDMEQLSNRLSKVFSSYPELFNHCVKVYQKRVDYYRLTSEGQKILQPDTVFHITARASIKTDGNEVKTEYYRLHVGGINDLPSEDALIGELHQFAQYMRQKSMAPPAEDLYIGPALYEDESAMELFAGKIANYTHSYWLWRQNKSDRKHRYLGKQVFPSDLSVWQLGNDSVYNGTKLLGYRQVDADGTRPKTLPLIEKGILKNMLTGRRPTLGCPTSTGNEHFYELNRDLKTSYTTGILHVTSNRPLPLGQLRKRFLKSAKKAGLKHAYIFRHKRTSPYALIRVDLNTGKEELVEGKCYLPSIEQFRRIKAVSKEKMAYNLNPTEGRGRGIIAPKAILLVDTELDITPNHGRHIDETLYELRH